MTEEIEEQNKKELKDKNNNNKIDNQSMMSIENNLITRKKVKIKTLRRLNLDLPDELLQYDNENEIASNKPTSRNQIIESYGDLTHKVGDLKKNSSTHFEQFNDIKNKLNIDNENNENDNFSNKDEEKKEENNEKEESEIEKNPEKENDKIDEEQNYKEKES